MYTTQGLYVPSGASAIVVNVHWRFSYFSFLMIKFVHLYALPPKVWQESFSDDDIDDDDSASNEASDLSVASAGTCANSDMDCYDQSVVLADEDSLMIQEEGSNEFIHKSFYRDFVFAMAKQGNHQLSKRQYLDIYNKVQHQSTGLSSNLLSDEGFWDSVGISKEMHNAVFQAMCINTKASFGEQLTAVKNWLLEQIE